MNAPIRYFGGKGTMKATIISNFPQSKFDIYIEPFAGSFTVGLSTNPAPCEIYNDLDGNVYALYKVLQDAELFEQFKLQCDLSIYSEVQRKESIVALKQDLTLVDRAFHFFYVNRTSRNGIGGFSINPTLRRKMSKSASDYLSAVDRLPELHDRLSKTIVRNMCGIKLIKSYNKSNVFMYLDPPYAWETRTSTRYPVDMAPQQQKMLVDVLLESNSKILLSGYECEEYKRLLPNFTKVDYVVNTVDGTGKKKSKIECLWRNY